MSRGLTIALTTIGLSIGGGVIAAFAFPDTWQTWLTEARAMIERSAGTNATSDAASDKGGDVGADPRRAAKPTAAAKPPLTRPAQPAPTAQPVSVSRAKQADFIARVLVTGSLVPRGEVLVGPEIEGLRIVKVLAEVGDQVRRGQVLATLVTAQIDAQLAQNTAGQDKARAAIAQAKSQIADAQAAARETRRSLERARPLRRKGVLSQSVFDQRQTAARQARARVAVAKDGLAVAQADLKQLAAQRRELTWRRDNTQIKAPAAGIVSRRTARVGAVASASGAPLFRIIAGGEIELEAEIDETKLARVKPGQTARVEVAGAGTFKATVRLIGTEIDPATRLGSVRLFLGRDPRLRIGSFARARIVTATARGVAVPQSSLLYGRDGGARLQLVKDGRVSTRSVELGLRDNDLVEIVRGLAVGDKVVTRAGTFLRDGDQVIPIPANPARLSEAQR
ncbi:MAG: efflux RND transporter periplasmic adaptor subunit [Pseudomonadota bacterium]